MLFDLLFGLVLDHAHTTRGYLVVIDELRQGEPLLGLITLTTVAAPVNEEQIGGYGDSKLYRILNLLGCWEFHLQNRADLMNGILVLLFDMSIVTSMIKLLMLALWLFVVLLLFNSRHVIFLLSSLVVTLHANVPFGIMQSNSRLNSLENIVSVLYVRIRDDILMSTIGLLLVTIYPVLIALRLHCLNWVEAQFLDLLLAVTILLSDNFN